MAFDPENPTQLAELTAELEAELAAELAAEAERAARWGDSPAGPDLLAGSSPNGPVPDGYPSSLAHSGPDGQSEANADPQAPGGTATPPFITSPTSPSAWAEIT